MGENSSWNQSLSAVYPRTKLLPQFLINIPRIPLKFSVFSAQINWWMEKQA